MLDEIIENEKLDIPYRGKKFSIYMSTHRNGIIYGTFLYYTEENEILELRYKAFVGDDAKAVFFRLKEWIEANFDKIKINIPAKYSIDMDFSR